jgi:uncharacterized membrane protein YeaQ/YmgE (transglycosylase-associated protein family)
MDFDGYPDKGASLRMPFLTACPCRSKRGWPSCSNAVIATMRWSESFRFTVALDAAARRRGQPLQFGTILGIVGAFVATYLGQALGWYQAGQGAGLIGATIGAVIVLLIWGAIAGRQGRTLT